MCVLVVLGVVL